VIVRGETSGVKQRSRRSFTSKLRETSGKCTFISPLIVQSRSATTRVVNHVYHGPLNLSIEQLFSPFLHRTSKRLLLSLPLLQPFKYVVNSLAANVDVNVHLNEHGKQSSSYCDSGG
jgi:hypothetical protein